jgi:hypothetical protein
VTAAQLLASLPGETRCYVPGVGEVSLAEIRATEEKAALDSRERTLQMWEYIATHPDAKPWLKNSGRSPTASGGSTE